MSARILVVDDEAQLRRAVRLGLEGSGFVVREAEDGRSALREVDAFKPDLVLLDLMLPDMTGTDVCRKIRQTRATPVIVLSVVGDEARKVEALDGGADDYLTKPFGRAELLARIRVALRHSARSAGEATFSAGGLSVDFERREVRVDGRSVHLTPTEYSVLKCLVANAGRVLTQTMLLREVWGAGYAGDSALLRTYINQLRSKLGDDASSPRFVVTEPGVGYRLIVPETLTTS